MKYLLGIDNGGTMTKAALFDINGNQMLSASRETPLATPRPGWNERNMDALWQANIDCIRDVMEQFDGSASDIVGVGCTGHGKGLYLWGDGAPAYAGIASTDRRAEEIVDRHNADGMFDRVRDRILQPIIACQPVPLLLWLKENHPEVLSGVSYIFECKDYIRFRLTGEARAEATDYSGTGLMDLVERRFDRSLLAEYGIEELYECLPPLCRADEVCGYITPEVAKETGLAAGTPVCGGMFDIDACAVAMDVTDPTQLCVITGTWSINEYPAPAPVRADTTTHNSLFCLPDTYLIEESSPTSAGNLDWYINNCLKAEKTAAKEAGRSFYDDVNAMVNALPPEESNAMFLPFLYGTNTDCDNAAFVGLSNGHSAPHMLRAIFEGVAFSHRQHIERLLAFRERPGVIRLAGGAARSRVWVQMFADILNTPIEVVSADELGALGCAMAAAVAAGEHPDLKSAASAMVSVTDTVVPDPAKVPIYDRKYKNYIRLTECLAGF